MKPKPKPLPSATLREIIAGIDAKLAFYAEQRAATVALLKGREA
jgi:hypothetical protein